MSFEFKPDFMRIQPSWCRKALPEKELLSPDMKDFEKRVLLYDPTELYDRLQYILNPYQYSSAPTMSKLFPTPKDKSICACGCGNQVQEGKRWASEDCWEFANAVWCIL